MLLFVCANYYRCLRIQQTALTAYARVPYEQRHDDDLVPAPPLHNQCNINQTVLGHISRNYVPSASKEAQTLKADLSAASALHANGRYNASAQRMRRLVKSMPRRFEDLLFKADLPPGLLLVPYLGRFAAWRQSIVYGDRSPLQGADSLEFAKANLGLGLTSSLLTLGLSASSAYWGGRDAKNPFNLETRTVYAQHAHESEPYFHYRLGKMGICYMYIIEERGEALFLFHQHASGVFRTKTELLGESQLQLINEVRKEFGEKQRSKALHKQKQDASTVLDVHVLASSFSPSSLSSFRSKGKVRKAGLESVLDEIAEDKNDDHGDSIYQQVTLLPLVPFNLTMYVWRLIEANPNIMPKRLQQLVWLLPNGDYFFGIGTHPSQACAALSAGTDFTLFLSDPNLEGVEHLTAEYFSPQAIWPPQIDPAEDSKDFILRECRQIFAILSAVDDSGASSPSISTRSLMSALRALRLDTSAEFRRHLVLLFDFDRNSEEISCLKPTGPSGYKTKGAGKIIEPEFLMVVAECISRDEFRFPEGCVVDRQHLPFLLDGIDGAISVTKVQAALCLLGIQVSELEVREIFAVICPTCEVSVGDPVEPEQKVLPPLRLHEFAPIACAARSIGLKAFSRHFGPGSDKFNAFKQSTVHAAMQHYNKLLLARPSVSVCYRVEFRRARVESVVLWSGFATTIAAVPPTHAAAQLAKRASDAPKKHGESKKVASHLYTCSCGNPANSGCTHRRNAARARLCKSCCKSHQVFVCGLKTHNCPAKL